MGHPLYERLDRPGIESSNERNNAGTGHARYAN